MPPSSENDAVKYYNMGQICLARYDVERGLYKDVDEALQAFVSDGRAKLYSLLANDNIEALAVEAGRMAGKNLNKKLSHAKPHRRQEQKT